MGCNCENTCDCGHGGHHRSRGCCGGGHGGFKRRFTTKEERLQDLESYLELLQKEVQAVSERIKDLKK